MCLFIILLISTAQCEHDAIINAKDAEDLNRILQETQQPDTDTYLAAVTKLVELENKQTDLKDRTIGFLDLLNKNQQSQSVHVETMNYDQVMMILQPLYQITKYPYAWQFCEKSSTLLRLLQKTEQLTQEEKKQIEVEITLYLAQPITDFALSSEAVPRDLIMVFNALAMVFDALAKPSSHWNMQNSYDIWDCLSRLSISGILNFERFMFDSVMAQTSALDSVKVIGGILEGLDDGSILYPIKYQSNDIRDSKLYANQVKSITMLKFLDNAIDMRPMRKEWITNMARHLQIIYKLNRDTYTADLENTIGLIIRKSAMQVPTSLDDSLALLVYSIPTVITEATPADLTIFLTNAIALGMHPGFNDNALVEVEFDIFSQFWDDGNGYFLTYSKMQRPFIRKWMNGIIKKKRDEQTCTNINDLLERLYIKNVVSQVVILELCVYYKSTISESVALEILQQSIKMVIREMLKQDVIQSPIDLVFESLDVLLSVTSQQYLGSSIMYAEILMAATNADNVLSLKLVEMIKNKMKDNIRGLVALIEAESGIIQYALRAEVSWNARTYFEKWLNVVKSHIVLIPPSDRDGNGKMQWKKIAILNIKSWIDLCILSGRLDRIETKLRYTVGFWLKMGLFNDGQQPYDLSEFGKKYKAVVEQYLQ